MIDLAREFPARTLTGLGKTQDRVAAGQSARGKLAGKIDHVSSQMSQIVSR